MGKIEEVARAICEASTGDVFDWELYDDEARAAIRAMREPTEKMEHAARVWSPSLRESYSEMIDAALNEQVSG